MSELSGLKICSKISFFPDLVCHGVWLPWKYHQTAQVEPILYPEIIEIGLTLSDIAPFKKTGAGQAQVDFSSTLIEEGVKGTKVKGR
jgi:hypothetical protein